MIQNLQDRIEDLNEENTNLQHTVSVHHNIVPHADRLEEKCIELSELNEQLVDKNDELVKELETWRLKFTDVDHDF